MAAGQGFKTFTTGEVLTAADVNGYLMQGINVFASSAARSAAITSPQEGQYSFLKDTNALEYYDGAAWVGAPVGDITAVTAGKGLTGGGSSGDVTVSLATTAKGDLVAGSGASTAAVLTVGANNTVLTADSTTATGLKWATPASGSTFVGCSLWNSTSVSAPNNTVTTMTFDSELFDTDGFHSTSSNTGRITIPTGKAGYYLLFGQITFLASSSGARTAALYKNGSASELIIDSLPASASVVNDNPQVTSIQYLAVGDYIEIKGQQASGGALNMRGGVYYSTFLAQYLGA